MSSQSGARQFELETPGVWAYVTHNIWKKNIGCNNIFCLFADMPTAATSLCWGTSAGPVPEGAAHVCFPTLPAPLQQPNRTHSAVWRNCVPECAAGRNLYWRV